MIKEAIRVSGAIGASTYIAPKIANKVLAMMGPQPENSTLAAADVVALGIRFGTGLAAYFLLGKVGFR